MKNTTPIKDISLSFKCPARWETMKKCDGGKFCNQCHKVVYDFTDKSHDEFQQIYIKNNGQVCGHFKTEQTVYTRKIRGWKKILSAIVIVFGYSLFYNEIKAQTTTGVIMPIQPKDSASRTYLGFAEQMPVFKFGGDQGLEKFLRDTIKYPADNPVGIVYASFVVDTNGKTKNAKILKGLTPDADAEVLRAINLLEFIPARQGGKKVETQLNLPVTFENDTHNSMK